MTERSLLGSQGEAYRSVMDRFAHGATLTYDGVAFALHFLDEIGCGLVSQSPSIDATEAREMADHAQSVFDRLLASSPEFADAVAGRVLRISILPSMDDDATELYRLVDGEFVTPN